MASPPAAAAATSKKRPRTENNPLAQARGVVSSRRHYPTTGSGAGDDDPEKKNRRTTTATRRRPPAFEQIWHRKSQAGLSLFLQYYAQQPVGTVSDDNNNTHPKALSSSNVILGQAPLPPVSTEKKLDDEGVDHCTATAGPRLPPPLEKGAGRSRASLRRQKKKKKERTPSDSMQGDGASHQPQQDPAIIHHSSPQSHPEGVHSSSRNTTQKCPTPRPSLSAPGDLHERSPGPLSGASAVLEETWQRLVTPTTQHLCPWVQALSRPLPLTFRLRQYQPRPGTEADCETPPSPQFCSSLSSFAEWVQPVDWWRPPPDQPSACGDDDPSETPKDIIGRTSPIYQATGGRPKGTLRLEAPHLHDWLQARSMDGTLARQEIGSMLPVLLLLQAYAQQQPEKNTMAHLDSKIGQPKKIPPTPRRALDLCASPGSKTMQLLEWVGPAGRVVANDVHPQRVEALREAVARSGLPPAWTRRLLIRQFDGQHYPQPKQLFDVVLCDVPCSGDGTIRKDRHILPLWTPCTAHVLHTTQVAILQRALQLVRPGGVVAYSTCSFNPIENEAVVAAVLWAKGDAISRPEFQLIDCPKIGRLTLRPGIKSWKVADYLSHGGAAKGTIPSQERSDPSKDPIDDDDDSDSPMLHWYSNYEEALAAGMENAVPSMWPPSARESASEHAERHREMAASLQKCRRLWPQDHNTGGFFVALIQRLPVE